MNTTTPSTRLTSLDILRGITICGMILVNNPGGGEENAYAPLLHAEWIGLTPTDLVFPFFMFIMGVSIYLSLRKYQFDAMSCLRKILSRTALLWLVGLAIVWTFMFTRGMLSDDNASLGLWDRLVVSANCFGRMRILGVLPRLAICYGIAAVVGVTVSHRHIPWLIAVLFIAYYVILEKFNGYAHDATSILAVVDDAILGQNHVYRGDCPDPEGILSTIPSVGHTLIGFCIGRMLARQETMTDKLLRLYTTGTLLAIAGALLAYLCPISKKMWTPTFALATCGMATLLLAVITLLTDVRGYQGRVATFFKVFGRNPLALYVISDFLLIPFSILPLMNGTTIQDSTYQTMAAAVSPEASSLIWAVMYILVNWLIGYYMYCKNITIKI